VLAPFGAVIVWRLLDDEAVLMRQLHGYAVYRAKVRRRIAPFIW
jgi:protein-S-isoprenylcysteine O-methyltransferase Ste14